MPRFSAPGSPPSAISPPPTSFGCARSSAGRPPHWRRTLAELTDDGAAISSAALSLWREVAPGKRIRLIGVSASNLEPAGAKQLTLLDWPSTERRGALNRAIDDIASRYGRDALRRGGM